MCMNIVKMQSIFILQHPKVEKVERQCLCPLKVKCWNLNQCDGVWSGALERRLLGHESEISVFIRNQRAS